jgi:type IV fimbrial biogenesis protein FimT
MMAPKEGHMDRRPKGFTLLELLTTLAVASTVVGIGVPAFNRALQAHKASAILSGLTASLATARIAAVSRNQSVVVCPSQDGTTCSGGVDWTPGWIIFPDLDRDRSRSASEPLLRHEPGGVGSLQVQATAGRRAIRFQPGGWAEGSNVTLSLCAGTERVARVIVNNAGRARTDRTSGTCGAY